jgi:hypothetical protein
MGDTLELFRPLCNGAVRVETRTEKLTGDAGFLLLREALDRTARSTLWPRDWRIPGSAPDHPQSAVAAARQRGDDRPGLG